MAVAPAASFRRCDDAALSAFDPAHEAVVRILFPSPVRFFFAVGPRRCSSFLNLEQAKYTMAREDSMLFVIYHVCTELARALSPADPHVVLVQYKTNRWGRDVGGFGFNDAILGA